MENSVQNGYVPSQAKRERSKSPNFGCARNPSTSATRRRPASVQYTYVKEEGREVNFDATATMEKPNNIGISDLRSCLRENQYDLKAVSRQEAEKANMKVMNAANQRVIESKTMKQNFNINDQGPSHGPTWSRPHTMIYNRGLKDGNTSQTSLLASQQRPYNRRRTENTIFQQDYYKQWNKILELKPVLTSQKLNT